MEKVELVVQALQERIGEIVSQYETHVAVLRAEITQLTIRIQEMEAPKEQPEG
jgi:phage host-nuclease inhibitor protein Gam